MLLLQIVLSNGGIIIMKLENYWKSLLVSIFIFLLALILIPIQQVKADVNQNVFNDGITNWVKYGATGSATSQIGDIPISNSIKLGYAFGAAINPSGAIGNHDSDFLSPTVGVSNGGQFTSYSKFNVFLNNNNQYYASVFQGKGSSQSIMNAQASFTSPDFMIVPPTYNGKVTTRDFSLLGYTFGSNGNIGLKNKSYYVGGDKDRPAYKIVGEFSRTASSYNGNQAYNLYAELVLRPSPTNAAIVQRELYLYNPNADTQSFQVLFGEDTALGTISNVNDNVPIYSLGDGLGLYINNGMDSSSSASKLLVTNSMPDGFTDFTGQDISNDNNATNWVGHFDSSGKGQIDSSTDQNLLGTGKHGNTAYTLKWPAVELGTKQQAHFGSTMGVTYSPYAVPNPTKTYTNETRSDGTNKVGDKLKFSLKMSNNGLNSKFNYSYLSDIIPEGFQLDTNSIKVDGNSTNSFTYDSATRELNVNTNTTLGDNKSSVVTFETTITNAASSTVQDKTVTNTGYFYGYDPQVNTSNNEYKASVDIPIKKTTYSSSFTKTVKNDSDTTYLNSTTGKWGEKVHYKIVYGVNNGSTSLADGATLTDDLPAGLKLVSGSVQYNNSYDSSKNITNGNSLTNIALGTLPANQTGTLTFDATIESTVAGTIVNNATIKNGSSNNASIGDMVSNDATVTVLNSDSFTDLPHIDFGTANMYGKNLTLTNVATNGGLQVAHPSSGNYYVNVAYDNNDEDKRMHSGKNTLSEDGSGLIFLKQRNSSPDDKGSWKPVLPTGTPIRSDTFTGGNDQSVDLTKYVGVGDWKINLDSNTQPGAYSGTLTWSMTDALSNS